MRIYYFGCLDTPGYQVWTPDGRSGQRLKDLCPDIPWETPLSCSHTPVLDLRQGASKLTCYRGWTVLAYWDYTIDDGPSGNSAFIAEGCHRFSTMVTLVSLQFPQVMARLGRPLFLARGSGDWSIE